MKKIILFVLIFFLLSVFASCTELPDEETIGDSIALETDFYVNRVHRLNGEYVEYGDYIYRGSDEGIKKYNRKTGEMTWACVDPTCDGTCIVENMYIAYFSEIVDHKIYFTANGYIDHAFHTIYASLDLVTGEVQELLRQLDSESVAEEEPIIANGYMYYTSISLKEGGDPQNSDDYEYYYNRLPLSGGSSERFCPRYADGVNCTICFAEDAVLYMYRGYDFIAYDTDTGEERVILETSSNCYPRSYLDGKIYYIQIDEASAEVTKGGTLVGRLYRLDVETGVAEQLIDDYIYNFIVTNDGIYYGLYEERTLYVPRDPEKSPVEVKWGGALYRCDLDGSNASVVCRNDTMNMYSRFTVIDGVFYGYVSNFFVEEGENVKDDRYGWNSHGFSRMDLKTGELIPWSETKK